MAVSVTIARTGRVLPRHVLGTGRLALFDAQVRDVEGWHVHVVRTVQVAQRPVALGTRQ